jgi:hypothetical protein
MFSSKANGDKLVGQCEISHPVRSEIGVDVRPWSPLDGMGETILRGQNVMFEQESKEDYELLDSRITRQHPF